jgi:lipopolysaccharide export system permease protein
VSRVPLLVVLKVAACLVLSFSHMIIPTAFLAATVVAMGRLSLEGELLAMRSAGRSMYRVALPIALCALLATAGGLTLSFFLAPWGERAMTSLLYTIGSRKAVSDIRAGSFNRGFYDLMIYAEGANTASGELDRVFVYDEREKGSPVTAIAKRGKIDVFTRPDALGSQALLTLFDGNIHRVDPQREGYEKVNFEKYSLFLKFEVSEIGAPDVPRMYSADGLVRRINQLRPDPAQRRLMLDYSSELWKRVGLGLSPLFFCFLGISLGTARARSTLSFGILATFVILTLYWPMFMWCLAESTGGGWHPSWLLQLPNIAVGILAVIFWPP